MPAIDSPLVEFIAAQCPNCAGNLQIPKDRDGLRCMYCGTAIERSASSPAARNVANWMQLAQHAQVAQNHEEAARYYAKVLEVDPRHAEAWLGKGISAGWMSTLAHMRLTEMCAAIGRAVEVATDEARPQIMARAAEEAATVAHAIWQLSWTHTCQFASVEGTWGEHQQVSAQAIEILRLCRSWAPESIGPLKAIEEICTYDLKGVTYELSEGSILVGILKPPAERAAELAALRQEAIEKLTVLCPGYSAPAAAPQASPVALIALVAVGLLLLWVFFSLLG
jgi:hypothetical protein